MKQYRWGSNKPHRENASAILRTRQEEEYLNRDAQVLNNVPIHTVASDEAYRPSSDYMKRRGVRSSLHYSEDTQTLSGWDGTEWTTVGSASTGAAFAVGTTDYAIQNAYATIDGCTVTVDVKSTGSILVLSATIVVRIATGPVAAGGRILSLRIREDATTVVGACQEHIPPLTVDEAIFTVSLNCSRTGVSGSHTYTLEVTVDNNTEAPTIESSTTDNKARINIIQLAA